MEFKSIKEIRENIDRIDRQIVDLLAERSASVKQAAKFKKTTDDVKAPQRVEQVIANIKALSEELGTNPVVVEQIYRAMISGFINQEMAEHAEMTPSITRSDPVSEYYTEEGCYITELSNSSGDPGLSIAQARVLPGVTTRWHRLIGTTERYAVISGKGLIEIGELPPRSLSSGDVALIPADCLQRISNPGTNDLIFLAICTPRFVPEAYKGPTPNQVRP